MTRNEAQPDPPRGAAALILLAELVWGWAVALRETVLGLLHLGGHPGHLPDGWRWLALPYLGWFITELLFNTNLGQPVTHAIVPRLWGILILSLVAMGMLWKLQKLDRIPRTLVAVASFYQIFWASALVIQWIGPELEQLSADAIGFLGFFSFVVPIYGFARIMSQATGCKIYEDGVIAVSLTAHVLTPILFLLFIH